MASDTTKKTTTKKSTTPKKKTTAASASKTTTKSKTSTAKKTTTTKKVATKTSVPKKKSEVKAPSTKVATKKKTTSTKKAATSKTRAPKKEKVVEIEREELETREADLNKTIVMSPEVAKELAMERYDEMEEIEEIKVSKNEKKDEKKYASTILGVDIPIGNSETDKKERKQLYAKDATIFAIIIPILDLFAMLFIDAYKAYPITNSEPINYCLTLIIDFILIFALTYLIDYIYGENSVKKMTE